MNIKIEEQIYEIRFDSCIFHASGEFAGNIDLILHSSSKIPQKHILKNLELKTDTYPRFIDILGYKENKSGYDLTFNSPSFNVPNRIEAYWDKNLLGTVDFTVAKDEVVQSEAQPAKKGRLGNYSVYSQDGNTYQIRQGMWLVGIIMAILFSPGLYFIMFDPKEQRNLGGQLVLAIVYAAALWCIGFYRKALFDKRANLFRYAKGFFFIREQRERSLNEIQYIRHNTFRLKKSQHDELIVGFKDRRMVIAVDGFGTSAEEAARLAGFIGCEFKR